MLVTDEYNFLIDDAYKFYRGFIFNIEQQNLLTSRGFNTAGSVAPVNWELFASILTDRHAKAGYGADLEGYEVKSAVVGTSFEYQYHLIGGKAKLTDDMTVDHIFISYSKDYRDVDVRLIKGVVLKPFFDKWMPQLIENYEGLNRQQRFRRAIPNGFVRVNGDLIMRTRNGELVVS